MASTKTVKIENSRHDLMADVTKTSIRIYGRRLVRTVNSDEIELTVSDVNCCGQNTAQLKADVARMAPSSRRTLANMIRDFLTSKIWAENSKEDRQYLSALIGDFIEGHLGAKWRTSWTLYFGYQFVQTPVWEEVDRTFEVGESAKHGEFNLEYFGTIRSVSAKTVVIDDRFDGTKRLNLSVFAELNLDFNVNETIERNNREMMYL